MQDTRHYMVAHCQAKIQIKEDSPSLPEKYKARKPPCKHWSMRYVTQRVDQWMSMQVYMLWLAGSCINKYYTSSLSVYDNRAWREII